MKSLRIVTFLLVLWPLVACASKQYILPTADGGAKPSPPSVQGRIATVEPGQVVITSGDASADASSKTVVRLTSATEIFTAAGGYVQPSQLVAGTRIRVWCAERTAPKPGQELTAAKVMIASKDPSDDWP